MKEFKSESKRRPEKLVSIPAVPAKTKALARVRPGEIRPELVSIPARTKLTLLANEFQRCLESQKYRESAESDEFVRGVRPDDFQWAIA